MPQTITVTLPDLLAWNCKGHTFGLNLTMVPADRVDNLVLGLAIQGGLIISQRCWADKTEAEGFDHARRREAAMQAGDFNIRELSEGSMSEIRTQAVTWRWASTKVAAEWKTHEAAEKALGEKKFAALLARVKELRAMRDAPPVEDLPEPNLGA